jgi:hypothetical protein
VSAPDSRFGRPLADPPLDPNEKLDIGSLLDGLDHYRSERRGWTWRQPVPDQRM